MLCSEEARCTRSALCDCHGCGGLTEYIPKISLMVSINRTVALNGDLVLQTLGRHNLFTGSGCQLGASTTRCVARSKLRVMTP